VGRVACASLNVVAGARSRLYRPVCTSWRHDCGVHLPRAWVLDLADSSQIGPRGRVSGRTHLPRMKSETRARCASEILCFTRATGGITIAHRC
jgi:hypothetical protein